MVPRADDRTVTAPTTESEHKGAPERARRRVVVRTRRPELTDRYRAGSVVTREEIEERLPRSAPDALVYEPGVYVQQTAHGQASAYLRGLTGQQTVLYYDGVRLNTSTFRQGPNQYFFTVNSRTIQKIEVVRGSASTRWGADAMGGAILSAPREPSLAVGKRPVLVRPRGIFFTTTADAALGGRAETDVSVKGKLGVLVGVGYRDVNQLRAGGPVISPKTGEPQDVPPLFAPDGKTQLGTGFRELTDDVRVVYQPSSRHRFSIGWYDYRQYDVPRTDKCPPPTAPQSECLTYNEQFRSLAYAKYTMSEGPALAETVNVTLSYQRQHEDRTLRVGAPSTTKRFGQDNVDTVGSGVQVQSRKLQALPKLSFRLSYGGDVYVDHVASHAQVSFGSPQLFGEPFTQYSNGSRYMTSGVWGIVESQITRYLQLRAGGRLGAVVAHAPELPDRKATGFDRYWLAAVAHGGIAVLPTRWLSLVANVDQGFRAPNIDDLTSRQSIGSGYQWENPALRHEKSTMIEGGVLIDHPWIELRAFVFESFIDRMVQRASRGINECPDPNCMTHKQRFQLVNLDGYAKVIGADGGVRIYMPYDLAFAATLSYARGWGPNPDALVSGQPATAPLSRVPPLHGAAEIGYRNREYGPYLVVATRWARAQTRLANQDRKDLRIPIGGTPGYVVFDIRAGYRLDPHVLLSLVFENVGDTAYRIHGSSVNGPGRGVLFEAQFGF
ncbi:MAG TPA: TonB-dependent receptor [Nannocystaceae bacterium]|nr:TonB-dependent receptor [Nannocystaceae bacterium]